MFEINGKVWNRIMDLTGQNKENRKKCKLHLNNGNFKRYQIEIKNNNSLN